MTYYNASVPGPGAMPYGTRTNHRSDLGLRIAGIGRALFGASLILASVAVALSLMSWSSADPSLTHATSGTTKNWMGPVGAIASDLLIQILGLAGIIILLPIAFWGLQLATSRNIGNIKIKLLLTPFAIVCLAAALSSLPTLASWPLRHSYGGIVGDVALSALANLFAPLNPARARAGAGLVFFAIGLSLMIRGLGMTRSDVRLLLERRQKVGRRSVWQTLAQKAAATATVPPSIGRDLFPSATAMVGNFNTPMPRPSACAPNIGQPNCGYAEAPRSASTSTHPNALNSTAYPIRPHMAPLAPSRAHVYPNPFLRAHPMTAAATAPMMSARSISTPQHFVTPVVVVPVAAYHQQIQQPVATPLGVANVTPQPTATIANADDHLPPFGKTVFDEDTDIESLNMARRFAPRDAAHVVAVRAQNSTKPTTPVERVPHRAIEPTVLSELPPSTAKRVAEMMADRRRNEATVPTITETGILAPSTSMLKPAPAQRLSQETSAQTLRGMTKLLLDTLGDYGVKGEITAVRPGPVVTLFEFEPARGTKSTRVIGLADDIARSMSATAVRIAVIPGRNAIGIELPNVTRETVYLRELIESQVFATPGMKLPLALGRDIGGEPVVTDLARMPHLLVAGTTGSGKSVGINAMILSLLYRCSPEECRLIMIDPKMLELSVYNDIPHLLAPVVTEPGKAVSALNWVVREMEDRYRRMARLAVRNIDAYNTRIRESAPGQSLVKSDTRPAEASMPYIVVIIDEFADLMAVAGKEIEFAVQRLAQMARAAGIHLIMATQRPSVDVITGTIKANFPTRISFRVTSRIDSRTILNEHGAEQLLGQGDMLFTGGSNGTVRVHGPYVSDEEVEAITTWLRANGKPDYSLDFADATECNDDAAIGHSETEGDEDDIYDRAVAVVVRDQKASTSYLQRRLSIGYNRAADLIERMERDGIIGPANHAGKRELLAPQAQTSATRSIS